MLFIPSLTLLLHLAAENSTARILSVNIFSLLLLLVQHKRWQVRQLAMQLANAILFVSIPLRHGNTHALRSNVQMYYNF